MLHPSTFRAPLPPHPLMYITHVFTDDGEGGRLVAPDRRNVERRGPSGALAVRGEGERAVG